MLTKEELLNLCDEAIEEKCNKNNEYYEAVIYLLKERGFTICEDGTIYKLTFVRGSISDNIYAVVKCGKYDIESDKELKACIDNLFLIGGDKLLDSFVQYVATVAIPDFKNDVRYINDFYIDK